MVGPRAGTIVPSVRPSNKIGSEPGPALYANVHSAYASFVGKPTRRLFKPYQQSPPHVRVGPITRTFMSDGLHEMLDVGSWKTAECFVAEGRVLCDARPSELLPSVQAWLAERPSPAQQPACIWLWPLLVWCPATRELGNKGKCQFECCTTQREGRLAIEILRINFDRNALREDILGFHQLVCISGHEG